MKNYDTYTPEIQYGEEEATTQVKEKPTPRPVGRRSGRKKSDATEQKRKVVEEKPAKPKGPSLTKRLKTAFTSTTFRIMSGIFIGCLAVYLGVSFLSYFTSCIQDQSLINANPVGYAGTVHNSGGEGGARLSEFLINECFGLGSFVIIFWLAAICLKLLVGKPRFKTLDFTIKCFVALITVSILIGLVTVGTHSVVNWGGYHGTYVNAFIIKFIGWTGAILLSFFMVALFVSICLRDLILWIVKKKRARDARRRAEAEALALQRKKEEEIRRMHAQEQADDIQAGETHDIVVNDEDPEDQTLNFGENDVPLYEIDDLPEEKQPMMRTDNPEGQENFNRQEEQEKQEDPIKEEAENSSENSENSENSEGSEDSEDSEGSEDSEDSEDSEGSDNSDNSEGSQESEPYLPAAEPEKKEDAQGKMVVNVNTIDQSSQKHFKSEVELYESHKYKFPPFDILAPAKAQVSIDEDELLEYKNRIERTLLDFNIPITQIKAQVGPTVTLFEIVPESGVKINKIRGLADDIAMRLSAKGVRIIAPIPGRGTVGIEVANSNPNTVSMRTVIQSNKYQESKYNLPIALGSTITNEVYIADLAKMPHLLIGGASGQGKSVGLNAIITSLLYCKAPHELKFVMIDPKQVEFSIYNKIKSHYMAMIPGCENEEPVITDMSLVEETLNSLCIEMENRYTLLKMAETRNIEEYNQKIRNGKLNPADGHRFLPFIVIIVDEFGDLIMVSGKNVEMPIARLAQKARAVGMHVVLATQRPSANVITGIIKANFPARISFKVSSGVDSKTILDTTGAQQLIGKGDMLISNNSEIVRVQCAFVNTPEVEALCRYISRQPYPTGPYILPEPKPEGGEDSRAAASLADRDPLFEESARKVVNSNTASTSALQRHYSIGYNRAGKIMDQLEAAGIVGPSTGGKPRAVLVDPITLEKILESLN